MLAGLWPIPSGSVHRPGPDAVVAGQRPAVYYVPQRPYTTPGSLRDQVLYPLSMAQVRMMGVGMGRQGGYGEACYHDCLLSSGVCGPPPHLVPLALLCLWQVMAPRYAAGSGRDELDAELTELMGVVRLK